MNYTYLHYQLGVTLLRGIGPKRAVHLIKSLENISDIFHQSLRYLHNKTGFSERILSHMNRENALIESKKIVAFINRHQLSTHFYGEPTYPHRLLECPDAPILLYSKGNIDFNASKFVAVVGTRTPTEYGKSICTLFLSAFKNQDIVVVSGLASGIDGIVHEYCLEHNIPTIGVLGHGLDRIYPNQHRKLAKQMVNKGALLTEFKPWALPDRENFPKRNRIVAGMCDATIVIESKSKGGSLITAELANGYHKDVFAFPGSIFHTCSDGCNALIANNAAHLLTSGDEFIKKMGWSTSPSQPKQQSIPRILPHDQQKIVDLLGSEGLSIDLLSMQLSLPVSTLNPLLFTLEMDGIVQQSPGRKYTLMH